MSFPSDNDPAMRLGPKADRRRLQGNEDPTRFISAHDWNELRQTLIVTRQALILQDGAALPPNAVGYTLVGSTNGRLQVAEGLNSARSVLRFYDPRDFGADGTGDESKAAANTAGINAAIAAILAETRRVAPNVSGSLQSGAEAALWLDGVYPVNDSIAIQPGMMVLGWGALIHGLDPTKDIFTTFGYGTTLVQGLRFRGGRRQVAVATGSVSDCVLALDRCEFIGPADMAIHLDVGCGPTSLVATGCHFGLGTTANMNGGALRAVTCDYAVLRDCYVAAGCPGDVFVVGDVGDQNDPGSGGLLSIEGMAGAPGNNTGSWITLYSGHARARRARFGGENGGKTVIQNYSSYSEIVFTDCPLYSPGPWAKLHRMPAHFSVDGNCDVGMGGQVWLDPAMPASDRRAIGNTQRFLMPRVGLNGVQAGMLETGAGADAGAVARAVTCMEVEFPRQRPAIAELLRTMPSTHDYGLDTYSLGTVHAVNTTDAWGYPLGGVQADADDAAFHTQYHTALAGLPTGQYTVVSELQVVNAPVRVELNGGDEFKVVVLEPGTHLVALPVYLDASTNLVTAGVNFTNMRSGGIARLGPIRVYAGRPMVDGIAAAVVGAAAPDGSAGAQQWLAGDVVLAATPAAGGWDRFRCVTAGWTAPAWVQLTGGHAVGLQKANGGNVYEVTAVTTGISGANPGPAGAGSGIVDGGVTWKFLAVVAAFKGAGALQA